jgi:two-component SAPR family response regulator
MSIINSLSFRNLFNLSQQQLAIAILLFILSAVLVWILSRGLFDLIRYFAFRFSHRESFVPKSWLFITVLGLASIFFISRGQVARATTIEIVADLDAHPESVPTSQPTQDLVSILSCAVVVAGLIFEIGKRRGGQLRQLQINSRLSHPSATAVRTEVALRATLDVKSPQLESIYLQANSARPIFVPLGISNSKIVLVDIGEQSVINICADDPVQSSAVFRALIAATLFASNSQIRPILLRKQDAGDPADTADPVFTQVEVISTVQEAIQIAKDCRQHCVLFVDSKIGSIDLDGLLASNCAIICGSATSLATAVLQATTSSWRLLANNLVITPYGLLVNEATAITELLMDVDRALLPEPETVSSHPQRARRGDQSWNVMVRTLGPVDVQLVDGTIIDFEKSKTKELLAWLTSHRARPTRSAARTALWEVNVADATFTNVVSDARRALNQTHLISISEEWLPRTFNDQLPFHVSIISDGEILESCIARAQELAPSQAIDELHRGLELVRDLPFSGTGYLWPDAEGITSQLVLNIITASAMAGELDLQRGEIEGVFWATAKGLKVLGAHEELIALRMRAHALRGDLAGVRGEWHSYERAVKADSWMNSQPSQKLVNLYSKINSGSPVLLVR